MCCVTVFWIFSRIKLFSLTRNKGCLVSKTITYWYATIFYLNRNTECLHSVGDHSCKKLIKICHRASCLHDNRASKKPINVLGSKLNPFEAVRCLFFEYCCVVWCIHSVLSVCFKKIMEQPIGRRVWLALGCFSSLHYCCWYKYDLNQGRIQEFLIGGGGVHTCLITKWQ